MEYKIVNTSKTDDNVKWRIVLPPGMEVLETFLLTESVHTLSIFLQEIECVWDGKYEHLGDCGDVFCLNIERATTQIKDTLAEFLEPAPPIQETELTVNTNELKDIMKIWIEKHTSRIDRGDIMESLLSDAVVTGLYPVCDYWQLITNGPVITINNPIEISYKNKVYLPCEIDKSLITGRRITGERYIENVLYEIVLENTLRIKISLCPDDYVCPEAVCISNPNMGGFVVF